LAFISSTNPILASGSTARRLFVVGRFCSLFPAVSASTGGNGFEARTLGISPRDRFGS
jgi:hypothetical protein